MPIHTQEHHGPDTARYYSYCACGVVGPLRRTVQAAIADHDAHTPICTGGPA